ncbi:MAG: helix-turn-helix domain-containing protein [Lachnospiraceae bacterium]|nr:helix-turn-helix domain-containing protein [Lachnospiraceae bacterium]
MALQECGLSVNRERRELCSHGTLEFPCAGYDSIYTEREGDCIPWHWHEELEIISIASGRLLLKIPEESFVLEEGSCAVVNANVLHYGEAIGSCNLHSLVFSAKLIAGSEESAFAKKYLSPLTACRAFGCHLIREEDAAQVGGYFRDAFDALARDSFGYEFIIRENLSRVCLYLYRIFEPELCAGEKGRSQDSLRLRAMLEYIDAHYAERITLAEIAKAADVGERECLRCFQKTIQISPVQYLLKLRVMKGAQMLIDDKAASVSEIALACGFDSPSNFSKLFKRFFRCSPREWRGREESKNLMRPKPGEPFPAG